MVILMRKDFPDWEGSREILVNVGGKPPGLAVRVLLETTAEKINKDVYVVKLTKVWDIEIGGKQPVSTWTYKVSGDKVELIGYEDNDDMVEIIK